MKVSKIVFLIFLVSVLCSKVHTATRGSTIARYCCERYSLKPISLKLVQTYEVTKSSCSRTAIIFMTKKGKKVCADPSAEWTQRYLASLKSQKVPT